MGCYTYNMMKTAMWREYAFAPLPLVMTETVVQNLDPFIQKQTSNAENKAF